MSAVILQLFPRFTDVNGDAQNALVLARRLSWAGEAAEVLPLEAGDPIPSAPPTAIVLGSGVDSSLARTRDALGALSSALTDWLAAGIPLLAVGTGYELLGRSVTLGTSTSTSTSTSSGPGTIDGLGIVPGETRPLPARVAGEIVVDSAFGRLVGYENHSRGLRLDTGVTPLGRVASGTGDGEGTDGVLLGSLFGTRLHGPVLARNPALAAAILRAAGTSDGSGMAARVDALAESINAAVVRRTQG